MNCKMTWALVLIAGGLAAYIYFYELAPRAIAPTEDPLAGYATEAIREVKIVQSNQTVRLNRGPEAWKLLAPISDQANGAAVESLLNAVAEVGRTPLLTQTNLNAVMTQFGLQPPQLTMKLAGPDGDYELRFGVETISGGQVYFDTANQPGIYLADKRLFQLASQPVDHWRDRTFFRLEDLEFDTVLVQAGNQGFTVRRMPKLGKWRMIQPLEAAADSTRIDLLLQALGKVEIAEFVSEDERTNAAALGLNPAELSVTFLERTNEVAHVKFGMSPKDRPDLVYARSSQDPNIFLVKREPASQFMMPYTAFRDRQLLDFDPDRIARVEINASERVELQTQTNGSWRVTGPAAGFPADQELVESLLKRLDSLEILRFDKDVVTDFAAFHLEDPIREYAVYSAETNPEGMEVPVARVQFGTNDVDHPDLVYARRNQESSVVSVSYAESLELGRAAWQFRERSHLWDFTPVQITKVTIEQDGMRREMIRRGDNEWILAPLYQGHVDPFGVEETVHRLGNLRALQWKGQGESAVRIFGINRVNHRVTLERQNDNASEQHVIAFGGRSPGGGGYAMIELDNQPVVFEIDDKLYDLVEAYLSVPETGGD